MKHFTCICIAFLLLSATAWAGHINLAWDPSPSEGVTGYLVYSGTSSGSYDIVRNAGNKTSYSGDYPDEYHYWAVTAYNADGLESGYSNEVTDLNKPLPPSKLKFVLTALAGIGLIWLIMLVFGRKKRVT